MNPNYIDFRSPQIKALLEEAANERMHLMTMLAPALSLGFASEPTLSQSSKVKSEKKNVKILLKEILFIESLKDYIKIQTLTKSIITQVPISAIERRLPESFLDRKSVV